ncbi:MAG TPA: hypothetical protein VFH51_16190 [Myxococcota bacterium]|nr:hypothetical protein [Myxococcota bacterium]
MASRDNLEFFVGSAGKLEVWTPAPNIVCSRVEGHLDLGMYPSILKRCQEVVDSGRRLISFHDWQDMSGYDTGARTEMTLWCLAHAKSLDDAHLLVKHQVVALGVSIAAVLVRNLKTYTERAAFQEALRRLSQPGQRRAVGG